MEDWLHWISNFFCPLLSWCIRPGWILSLSWFHPTSSSFSFLLMFDFQYSVMSLCMASFLVFHRFSFQFSFSLFRFCSWNRFWNILLHIHIPKASIFYSTFFFQHPWLYNTKEWGGYLALDSSHLQLLSYFFRGEDCISFCWKCS